MDHVFQDLCKSLQINLFYTFSTCPAKVRRLRQMLRPAREAKMHLIHRDLYSWASNKWCKQLCVWKILRWEWYP